MTTAEEARKITLETGLQKARECIINDIEKHILEGCKLGIFEVSVEFNHIRGMGEKRFHIIAPLIADILRKEYHYKVNTVETNGRIYKIVINWEEDNA